MEPMNITLKKTGFFFICALLICNFAAADQFDDWTNLYGSLLKKHVVEGKKRGIQTTLVKYNDLRNDSEFRKALYDLARLPSFETLSSKEDQLAMWINAYNMLILKVITENPKIKSIRSLSTPFNTIWKRKAGVVAKQKYSLDEIENEIVRAKFQDPRAHFALVCASLSCPDLANYAYQGKYLDDQLSHQASRFLNNKTKGMKISSPSKKIYLSKIFKWYSDDFHPSVKGWLHTKDYINVEEENYSVSYMSYDWELNGTN